MSDDASIYRESIRAGRADVPGWITSELLDKTVRYWSKRYGFLIGKDEAIDMILRVGTLVNVLFSENKSWENNSSPGHAYPPPARKKKGSA